MTFLPETIERDPPELRPKALLNTPKLHGLTAVDGTETTRALSELGNAERLNDIHSGNLHYVNGAKAWLHYR